MNTTATAARVIPLTQTRSVATAAGHHIEHRRQSQEAYSDSLTCVGSASLLGIVAMAASRSLALARVIRAYCQPIGKV